MNSSHYPSLELCRKLTSIGFPDTEKKWYKFDFDSYGINSFKTEPFVALCPSVMEMLDVMPYLSWFAWISIEKATANYIVSYRISYWNDAYEVTKSSLPNALAEMILWLHENNYISFSK